MSQNPEDIQSSLQNLSLDTSTPPKESKPKTTPSKKKTPTAFKPHLPVADSWEDEAEDDDNDNGNNDNNTNESTGADTDTETDTSKETQPLSKTTTEGPFAPPPTPISPPSYTSYPSTSSAQPATSPSPSSPTPSSSSSAQRDVRPEKQTAVANRLIAGALGMRAPKRTEEQRAYDRAVKEKEIKRKNREKEEARRAKEEEENAKKAIWDG